LGRLLRGRNDGTKASYGCWALPNDAGSFQVEHFLGLNMYSELVTRSPRASCHRHRQLPHPSRFVISFAIGSCVTSWTPDRKWTSFISPQVDPASRRSDYGMTMTIGSTHQKRRRILLLHYRTSARYTTGVLTKDAGLSLNRRKYT
jgi:hypothetical protein